MKWVVTGPSGDHEVEVERSSEGFEVIIGGRRHEIDLICLDGAVASLRFVEDGRSFQVAYQHGGDHQWRVGVGEREFDLSVLTPVEAIDTAAETAGSGPSRIEAPIPGKVVAVAVASGDEVASGQPLVVLEAMKMENELTADRQGRVVAVHVAPGDTVEAGELLVELE
jgi:biotin carboxyl carrier protein